MDVVYSRPMRLAFAVVITAVTISPPPAGAGAQSSAAAGVDALYPTERLQPADASERRSCAHVLTSGPAGEPALVVAAYADRTSGVIRVLRRGAGGVLESAFDSPTSWAVPGTRTRCVVRASDLDFDGRPELFVMFDGPRASVGWVVRWDGTRLLNLTPTQVVAGREQSLLLNPAVYDLEHQGSLRVVAARDFTSPPPGVPAAEPAYVYRLGASRLEVEGSLLAIMGFRGDVNPASNLRTFRVITDSAAPYIVRVINGDREGRHRVSSATLTMNNVEMIGPSHLHAATEFATATLPALFVQNRVTAKLSGTPDAFILVLVQDSTRR